MVVDSRCSMWSTNVVRMRSKAVVNRPSISSGFRPVNCQATAITGMLIFGKISVGVRRIMTGLANRISSAKTINVYGRFRATLTIHIMPYLTHESLRRGLPDSGQARAVAAFARLRRDAEAFRRRWCFTRGDRWKYYLVAQRHTSRHIHF